jgi:hypothetical protein
MGAEHAPRNPARELLHPGRDVESGGTSGPPDHGEEAVRMTGTDWSRYRSYRCIECQELCLNAIYAPQTGARQCRTCFDMPSLEDTAP